METKAKHTYEYNFGYLSGAVREFLKAFDSGSYEWNLERLRDALKVTEQNIEQRYAKAEGK